jgi:hypothetical protein
VPDITSYPAIVTVEGADVIPIVDVSDPTQSPAGTTKIITVSQLGGSGGGGGGSGYALLSGAEYTCYVAPAVVTLSYASTITITATQGNDFRVTLTGNPTFAAPVSPTDGQTIQIWLTQDGTGNRIVTWNSAFNFGTGGSAPVLSTAANATDIVGFSFNATTSLWKFLGSTTGGNAAGIGVTLTGTPAAGLAPIATSSTAAEWSAPYGTRPEWYGTITGTSGDQTALTAAISAINAGSSPGPLVLTQRYAIDSTVTLLAGVDVVCVGQGNRQNFPDTFTGGVVVPSSLFPTGSATPLIAIGSTGTPTTNPCGVTLDGLCLNGIVGGTGSTNAANCVGLLVTDTADVHLTNAYLANFDRPGGTGTAISLASSSAGNGVGFVLEHSVISASQQGLYAYGAGVTDLRLEGNLWHACTEQITLGYNGTSSAGGGGFQIVNDHFTYTGVPSTGWYLLTGSQAGDFQVTNCYMDQAGSSVPVQLGNDKGVFADCHWLAASTSTAVSLAKVTVSAPAELNFTGHNVNLNGSSLTALLQTSAHAGIPAGGLWLNNTCFNTGGSYIAPLIDSASAVIPQITQPPGGTSTFLRADGTWVNPSVTGGTVSGSFIATPTVYAPGSITPLTVSSSTLAAFSSANVNTGSFTAPASGTVVVTVSCLITMTTANTNYSLALAAHGTATPLLGTTITCETSSAAIKLLNGLTFVVSSLTPSASYTLDLLGAIAAGSLSIQALGSTSTTPTGTIGAPVTMIVEAV